MGIPMFFEDKPVPVPDPAPLAATTEATNTLHDAARSSSRLTPSRGQLLNQEILRLRERAQETEREEEAVSAQERSRGRLFPLTPLVPSSSANGDRALFDFNPVALPTAQSTARDPTELYDQAQAEADRRSLPALQRSQARPTPPMSSRFSPDPDNPGARVPSSAARAAERRASVGRRLARVREAMQRQEDGENRLSLQEFLSESNQANDRRAERDRDSQDLFVPPRRRTNQSALREPASSDTEDVTRLPLDEQADLAQRTAAIHQRAADVLQRGTLITNPSAVPPRVHADLEQIGNDFAQQARDDLRRATLLRAQINQQREDAPPEVLQPVPAVQDDMNGMIRTPGDVIAEVRATLNHIAQYLTRLGPGLDGARPSVNNPMREFVADSVPDPARGPTRDPARAPPLRPAENSSGLVHSSRYQSSFHRRLDIIASNFEFLRVRRRILRRQIESLSDARAAMLGPVSAEATEQRHATLGRLREEVVMIDDQVRGLRLPEIGPTFPFDPHTRQILDTLRTMSQGDLTDEEWETLSKAVTEAQEARNAAIGGREGATSSSARAPRAEVPRDRQNTQRSQQGSRPPATVWRRSAWTNPNTTGQTTANATRQTRFGDNDAEMLVADTAVGTQYLYDRAWWLLGVPDASGDDRRQSQLNLQIQFDRLISQCEREGSVHSTSASSEPSIQDRTSQGQDSSAGNPIRVPHFPRSGEMMRQIRSGSGDSASRRSPRSRRSRDVEDQNRPREPAGQTATPDAQAEAQARQEEVNAWSELLEADLRISRELSTLIDVGYPQDDDGPPPATPPSALGPINTDPYPFTETWRRAARRQARVLEAHQAIRDAASTVDDLRRARPRWSRGSRGAATPADGSSGANEPRGTDGDNVGTFWNSFTTG